VRGALNSQKRRFPARAVGRCTARWADAVAKAAAALCAAVPAGLRLPVDELVALAARVNSNAYGITCAAHRASD
jgi:hypothetical protein